MVLRFLQLCLRRIRATCISLIHDSAVQLKIQKPAATEAAGFFI